MNNKFKYPIFPDRTYTLVYEDFSFEVLGKDIMSILYKELYLENAAGLVAKQNTLLNIESRQDKNPSMTP